MGMLLVHQTRLLRQRGLLPLFVIWARLALHQGPTGRPEFLTHPPEGIFLLSLLLKSSWPWFRKLCLDRLFASVQACGHHRRLVQPPNRRCGRNCLGLHKSPGCTWLYRW